MTVTFIFYHPCLNIWSVICTIPVVWGLTWIRGWLNCPWTNPNTCDTYFGLIGELWRYNKVIRHKALRRCLFY